ncbi:accessory gene regulator ArgB-like protein [Alkaliphilus serpentinus]|uniref:Accessory gene regulator B family protein n=1 Tax=Alkaliphilus serpentinus TaxID=1482731 RepID=A0A833HN34_9FIRM|nr:accessory gene regulator B family protein [Alkaliphilus serpentinus]KAB3529181.1 accessory gene regulator B family protein [Alkaliphilus serpentinus]
MIKNITIDSCIDKILSQLNKHSQIDEKQRIVLTYGTRIIINSVISYSLALLLALIIGVFKEVLIILFAVSILRGFSGGAHNSNIRNCAINGAIISNLLGLIVKYFLISKATLYSFIIVTFFIALWAIGKYAPADTPGKPITTITKRYQLKRRSFIVLSLWCFMCIYWFLRIPHVSIIIYASTLGILWQSMTLTKNGYKLYNKVDQILNLLFRRVE